MAAKIRMTGATARAPPTRAPSPPVAFQAMKSGRKTAIALTPIGAKLIAWVISGRIRANS